MNISELKAIIEETRPEDVSKRLALENYFPKNPEKYTVRMFVDIFVYMVLVKRKVKKLRKEIRRESRRNRRNSVVKGQADP